MALLADEPLAPLIAVVGSDGSGKSTLAADILAHIRKSRPAEMGYLGLGSGEQGRSIGRWPVIGAPLQRYLEGIADKLRDPQQTVPGVLAARYAMRRSRKRREQQNGAEGADDLHALLAILFEGSPELQKR